MILDLVNKEKSQIPYEIISFSDGQVLVDVDTSKIHYTYNGEFIIYSRGSWADLQKILCAYHALRFCWDNKIQLYIPYIGGRSDRRFSDNQANYLKEVYAPILNSMDCWVHTIDPHSDVTEAVITKCDPQDQELFVQHALKDINTKSVCLVVPDSGALKKANKIINLFNSSIVCNKERDIKTGHIIGVTIPEPIPVADRYLIVDDICDGGQTFLHIGQKLKRLILSTSKIGLAVTHGIFSRGFDVLHTYYDKIYTTNSIIDEENTPYFVDVVDCKILMNLSA